MKIKLLASVLIWFCVFENAVFSQKENYIWYFGDSAGVDFNSGSPVALTNGVLNTQEGSATISDSNGALLFYTDGITVWDRNHNQMPDGDSLAGGVSSTQSALIVPFPGNNLMYYIFTVEQELTPDRFCYSIADMSLNNGNGNITVKNNVLVYPVTEKLASVKHQNNLDIWVMVHGYENNSFYAYLVTAAGISAPVISNVGATIGPGVDLRGQMKFSPDGSHIAFIAFSGGYVDLFDFNKSTGAVTNEKYLTLPCLFGYGLEFSQSANYLYCTTGYPTNKCIYQWDITSNNAMVINSTLDTIGTTATSDMGELQLGPDGKIYVVILDAFNLGAINNPEMPGLLSNYVDSIVSLAGAVSKIGLPNFISSYFLPTGINTNIPQQNQLTISPNPATTEFQILNFQFQTGAEIQLTDALGKRLFTKKISNPTSDFRLLTSGFSNGIYFLSVQTGKEIVTKKIVINR